MKHGGGPMAGMTAAPDQKPQTAASTPPTMPQMGEVLVDQHLENIKRQLGITETQADTWKGYTEAFKAQMVVHAEKHQQRAAMATMNSLQAAQERLKIMEKAVEKRRATVAAYDKLFASFSEEQKGRANLVFSSLPMMGGL